MAEKRKTGLGLLPRLYLGVFIPILIAFMVIGMMIFFTWNLGGIAIPSLKDVGTGSLKEMSTVSVKESKASLDKLGEKLIQEKALSVADQMEVFIKSHPRMKREDLLRDPWLKELAVQKVGETGYTAVHDDKGINYFHINPKIVGSDLHQLIPKFPAFGKILEASFKGPALGYYDWPDADGKVRPKYMYLTPIRDTDLIVASTTYIEEFSKPSKAIEEKMKQIEKQYLNQYERKFQIFYIVILIVLVVLLAVIYFYSRSVIHPIRHLSEVANKISMGDLDAPIQIKATGEVGVLAESIERMQTSVKAAIERLQKRREPTKPK
jgi:HAMP domain-containing protein